MHLLQAALKRGVRRQRHDVDLGQGPAGQGRRGHVHLVHRAWVSATALAWGEYLLPKAYIELGSFLFLQEQIKDILKQKNFLNASGGPGRFRGARPEVRLRSLMMHYLLSLLSHGLPLSTWNIYLQLLLCLAARRGGQRACANHCA
jgi:hypothetical protein